MHQKCEIVHIHQKPQLRPKPGQAKPDFWLWARLTVSASQSHLKPGQSQGFQAKPGPHITSWNLYSSIAYCLGNGLVLR